MDRVLRINPRGRLPVTPLLDAVRARATELGTAVDTLFEDPAELTLYKALAIRSDRSRRGRSRVLDPENAARIARAVWLDVHRIYRGEDGNDRYARALKFAGSKVDVRRPGVDVTVSAPKSVSILFALGDPDVTATVRAAHQAPVGETLAYLESVAGHGLRGHQGNGKRAARIPTHGWSSPRSSTGPRTPGTQLHTHLVVPNLVHGFDGKWSALDSRAIHQHALTVSYLYHEVLRGQLTQRLGVAWTTPEKGIAEVVGIPVSSSRCSQLGGAKSCAPSPTAAYPERERHRRHAWPPAQRRRRTRRSRHCGTSGRQEGSGGRTRSQTRGRSRARAVPGANGACDPPAGPTPARAGRSDCARDRVRPPRPAAGPMPSAGGPACRRPRASRGRRGPGAEASKIRAVGHER